MEPIYLLLVIIAICMAAVWVVRRLAAAMREGGKDMQAANDDPYQPHRHEFYGTYRPRNTTDTRTSREDYSDEQ